MIKLAVFDLDGTLLDSAKHVSVRNRAALRQAMDRGIRIVIASGRPKSALPQEVLEIEGISYAITSNGSSIFHLPDMKRICRACTNPTAGCVHGLRKSTLEIIAQQKCIRSLLCSAARLDMQLLTELRNTTRQYSKICLRWSISLTDVQQERYMKKRLRI